MSTIILSMFILMAASLIIGFILGWYIRRSATRNRYQREIDTLAMEDDEIASKLYAVSNKYEGSKKDLEYSKYKLTSMKQEIKDFTDRDLQLSLDIEKLKLSQKELENDLHEMDDKIKNLSDELDILKSQESEILDDKGTIEKFEQKIDHIQKEIDTNLKLISDLISERDILNTKVINLETTIKKKEEEIAGIDNQIKIIEDEFQEKTNAIKDDIKSTRVKALNYQYALNYVDERLKAKEPIKFDVIDKIISKNEEKGLFENIIQKLFSKSAKYIKEGR